ncbi:hypothetical protein MKW92_048484, partial [Papaver armeniacum]
MLLSVNAVSAEDFAVNVGEDLPENYGDWFPEKDVKDKRRAGILLHPTSLHGNYGIGDLGDDVFKFLDWLHDAGCSVWQVLPLVPPGRKANEEGSPYSGQDANCGNTLLISLEELVKDGLLNKDELPKPMDEERVKFEAVASVKEPLIAKINNFIAQQFLFQRQWHKVRKYAQSKGIRIMGDMPIYVGYHSADVWANKKQFLLVSVCISIIKVPLYDWKAMEAVGFSWWVQRIRRAHDLYDEFRIDHFRGFAGFWAVPAESKIAMFGKWKFCLTTGWAKKALFDAIFKSVGKIDIVAEDLKY